VFGNVIMHPESLRAERYFFVGLSCISTPTPPPAHNNVVVQVFFFLKSDLSEWCNFHEGFEYNRV
jgi:hypothetical protein